MSGPNSFSVLCLSMLLLLLLASSLQAFAPLSRRPALVVGHGSTLSSSLGYSASTPTPITVLKSTVSEDEVVQATKPKAANQYITPAKDDHHCLELDPVGRLRLCNRPDILLQGLNPAVWSSSRPVSGKTNSLFLHTSHPESLPVHQTSLGNLISCHRLIACARKLYPASFFSS